MTTGWKGLEDRPQRRYLKLMIAMLVCLHVSTKDVKGIENLSKDEQYPESFTREGDLMLGGLFDLHFLRVRDGSINPLSLQWMYAMVFAIETINNRTDILPGVTLGFDIRDTKGDANTAVSNSLGFITQNLECESSQMGPSETSSVAVIGPRTNNAAVDTANLFDLFEVPQVSYAATSHILSQSQYEFFMRTAPSIEYQVTALLDVITNNNWTTVILLNTDDFALGRAASQLFAQEAAARNVCVALQRRFKFDSTAEEISDIGRDIRLYGNIRVLVAFAEESPMLHLLDQFRKDNLTGYVWLGTDSWTVSTQLTNPWYFPVVKGMLGLVMHSPPIDDFAEYLRNVRVQKLDTGVEDPFLAEYWETSFNCSYSPVTTSSMNPCNSSEMLLESDAFFYNNSIGSIFDAVEVTARGLHDLLRCSDSECPEHYSSSKSKLLFQSMINTSFSSYSNSLVKFKANGDLATPPRYVVRNLVPAGDCNETFRGTWKNVFHWNSVDSLQTLRPIVWPYLDICNVLTKRPFSYCSSPCTPGQRVKNTDNTCCWNCTQCGESSYSQTQNALVCKECAKNQSVNADSTGCDDLTYCYIGYHTITGNLLAATASFGLLFSVVIYAILILKRVKCMYSSYGHVIFLSTLSCFGTSFLCFINPTVVSCSLTATFQPLPVTVLLTMLMVVSYSLYSERKNLLGKTFLWLMITICIHLMCVAIWLLTGGPTPAVKEDYSAGIAYVDCVTSGDLSGYFLILCFQISLDICGAVFSYSLRMNKANFYEGKFLFSTFVVHGMFWSAVAVTYLLLPSGDHSRSILVCQSMVVAGFISMGSLFIPKLYALKYKPHMLRTCTLVRDRQWKFKRKQHNQGKKVYAKRAFYLRGFRKALRALHTETRFLKRNIEEIKTSCSARHRKTVEIQECIFSDLRDMTINMIINSPGLDGTRL